MDFKKPTVHSGINVIACSSGKKPIPKWIKAGPWVSQCHWKDAEIHRCH